jgi:excisionase family DNA binding protein
MPDNKPFYRILEFADAYSLGRSTVYKLLAGGELKARKVGRATVILKEDADRWAKGLKAYTPAKAA